MKMKCDGFEEILVQFVEKKKKREIERKENG